MAADYRRAIRLVMLSYIRFGLEVEQELDETRLLRYGSLFMFRLLLTKILRSAQAVSQLTIRGHWEDAHSIVRSIYDVMLDIAFLDDDPSAAQRYLNLYLEEDILDQADEIQIWIKTCGGRQKARKEDSAAVLRWEELDARIRWLHLRAKREAWRRIKRETKRVAFGRVFALPKERGLAKSAIVRAIEYEGDAQVHSRPVALRSLLFKDRRGEWAVCPVASLPSHKKGGFAELACTILLDRLLFWIITGFQLPIRFVEKAEHLSRRVVRANKLAAKARASGATPKWPDL